MSLKGLHAFIYTDADYRQIRERTAPGMSDGVCHFFAGKGVKGVTLIGEEFDPIFEADEKYPPAKLVRRIIGGEEVLHIEPLDPGYTNGQRARFQAGGAFVHTSDSRFGKAIGFYGAVSLHDRSESVAVSRQLSR